MAARQGLTAHVAQASEDARRAVLNRAPTSVRSHSWLSNLNTTCTIKSAPPRTPEVMTMLSTKAGWLVKRNEQHVWQRRWCCVVPHSFLYYFDAGPADLNENLGTVCEGEESHGEGGHHHHHHDSSTSHHRPYRQPVGIIDLECYTTVDRSRGGDDASLVLELTGDAVTNPDLRSFFFEAECPEDCEDWTKAFLSDRHSALRDEREAYRQVCDSFPLQLAHCSRMVDDAEAARRAADRKAYVLRSAAEESRKRVERAARDALEAGGDDAGRRGLARLDAAGAAPPPTACAEALAAAADALREERNAARAESAAERDRAQTLARRAVDGEEAERARRRADQAEARRAEETRRAEERVAALERLLAEERRRGDDAERELEAKKMEFGMLSAASKQKIQELTGHKRVLKREVIELRQRVEDVTSDATVYRHRSEGLDLQVRAAKDRAEMLERHLDHITERVKAQERMMENMSVAMSASVAGSIYDDRSRNGASDLVSVGSFRHSDVGVDRPPDLRRTPSSVGRQHVPRYPGGRGSSVPPEITSTKPPPPVVRSGDVSGDGGGGGSGRGAVGNARTQTKDEVVVDDEDVVSDVDVEVDDPKLNADNDDLRHCRDRDRDVVSNPSSETNDDDIGVVEAIRNGTVEHHHDEDDDDSHFTDTSRGNMSELTEDRTYRSDLLAGVMNHALRSTASDLGGGASERFSSRRPPHVPPPHASSSTRPPPPSTPSQQQPPVLDAISIGSSSPHHTSVARRARLEAESSSSGSPRFRLEPTTPTPTPPRTVSTVPSSSSEVDSAAGGTDAGSVWSRLSSSVIQAVDNSVLGVNVKSPVVEEKKEEARPAPPPPPPAKPLTLAERQRAQREKQTAFLRRQGLTRLRERADNSSHAT